MKVTTIYCDRCGEEADRAHHFTMEYRNPSEGELCHECYKLFDKFMDGKPIREKEGMDEAHAEARRKIHKIREKVEKFPHSQ